MSGPRNVFRLLRNPFALAALALGLGVLLGRGYGSGGPDVQAPSANEAHGHEEEATIWTCAMHPQIRLPEPGQCPICFMDLIPLQTGAGDDSDVPRLEMSEAARAMAEIETKPVVRGRPFAEVRLVGKVDYDETRVGAITAWMSGRLDRLYVDYTGLAVRKGDHLAEIYSPELLSAQEELLQAIRSRDATAGGASSLMRGSADATVEAAREKLRLLGLTGSQIDAIESGGDTSDHVTLFASSSGVVLEKNAVEGDYVSTGTVIYRIADLSQLWVMLDAYESDLVWLRYGQHVEFTTEAIPGETFRGDIVFISPTMDPRTRTSKVRVQVDNTSGLLKPEMFVRGEVLAEVGGDGHVVVDDLAGKWICPMHPEVVEESPGSCRICGMGLERAEDLGHVSAATDAALPLMIPRTAVLLTGKRAIVYVEEPDGGAPAYEGREVTLGARAGDFYIVKAGVQEGERVVTRGNFKIDSALQIQAKPSMMSASSAEKEPRAGDGDGGAPAPEEFLAALTPLYDAYFTITAALSKDDLDAARTAFHTAHEALHAPEEEALPGRSRKEWRRIVAATMAALAAPGEDADIAAFRESFEGVSESIVEIERVFGHAGEAEHFLTFCPMAFGSRGAHWLQDHKVIDNPYLGLSMPRCGEVQEEFAPAGEER